MHFRRRVSDPETNSHRIVFQELEPRLLLSTIAGTVFNDANDNGIQDVAEAGIAGIQVELLRTAPTSDRLSENQVLVVYNSRNSYSHAIFDHYRTRRPGVFGFDLDDPDLLPGAITYDAFRSQIRDPIRNHLAARGLTSQIVVLTVTKGLPHRILDLGPDPGVGERPNNAEVLRTSGNLTFASVDSELTLLWQDLLSQPVDGESGGRLDSYADNSIINPYYGQVQPISRHRRTQIDDGYAFRRRGLQWVWRSNSAGASRSDAGRTYLTTRLDGNSVDEVTAMIDRSMRPIYDPNADLIIIDRGSGDEQDEGDYERALSLLDGQWSQLEFDDSNDFMIGNRFAIPDPAATRVTDSVAALISYGGNHSQANQGNYIRTFQDQLVDGAIISTFESFNAKKFGGLDGFLDHGQLSEWVTRGGTFGVGHVWEPFPEAIADNAPMLDAFFLKHLSWAESAWSAIPMLSSQHVVLGDPLAVASVRPVAPVVTDAVGNYTFGGLPTGAYYLTFDAPGDLRISPMDQGDDDRLDSDADPLTGRTDVFRLSKGVDDGHDLGLFAEADQPSLTAQNAVGFEDTPIPLNFLAQLNDQDNSEVLSIVVDAVPPGAELSAGVDQGEGTWQLDSGQLDGLTFTPPLHRDDNLLLTITAVATEPATGDTATASDTINITVTAVADAPSLFVQSAAGAIDTPIPLQLEVDPIDTDGSQTTQIVIGAVPPGAVLSAGTPFGIDQWVVGPQDLAQLSITPPVGSGEPFELTVDATATEQSNGHMATSAAALEVIVYTPVSLTGASEDLDFEISYASLLTGALNAGVNDPQFVLATVLSGSLTADGLPAVVGTTLVSDTQLTWRGGQDANGPIAAFRLRANGIAATATLQIEVVVDPVNDAPTIGGLSAQDTLVGLGQDVVVTATEVADPDDTELTVRFYVDRNGDDMVDDGDMLVTETNGTSATLATTALGLGEHRLLAEAIDPLMSRSAPVATTVSVADVLGGPAQQDAASKRTKRIMAPFVDDAGRSISISLSGPGTVELLVAPAADFRRIVVRGSASTSSLSISGATFVDDILVLGPLRQLNARRIQLRRSLKVDAVASIRLQALGPDHAVDIGPSSVAVKITVGHAHGLHVRSDSPIGSLRTTLTSDGDGSMLAAPSIGRLTINGDARFELTLAGGLGAATIKGALAGTWQVAGSVDKITADAITAWVAQFSGTLNRLTVRGDAAGQITAAALGLANIRGNYDGGALGATLRLTRPIDQANPKIINLRRLSVGGIVRRLDIRSVGHLGSISAKVIVDSRIYAGVSDQSTSLPAAADLVTQARIDRVQIRGGRGKLIWLDNGYIAAAQIGTITFGFAQTDNAGIVFGIATGQFGLITYRDDQGNLRARAAADLGVHFPIGDLAVRLV